MMIKQPIYALLFAGLSVTSVCANDIAVVTSDDWSRPRTASYVRALPQVNAIIKAWLDNKEKHIEIRYPGGEEGELWAAELKDWLVALGISGEGIVLQPGMAAPDKLALELIQPYQ